MIALKEPLLRYRTAWLEAVVLTLSLRQAAKRLFSAWASIAAVYI